MHEGTDSNTALPCHHISGARVASFHIRGSRTYKHLIHSRRPGRFSPPNSQILHNQQSSLKLYHATNKTVEDQVSVSHHVLGPVAMPRHQLISQLAVKPWAVSLQARSLLTQGDSAH